MRLFPLPPDTRPGNAELHELRVPFSGSLPYEMMLPVAPDTVHFPISYGNTLLRARGNTVLEKDNKRFGAGETLSDWVRAQVL